MQNKRGCFSGMMNLVHTTIKQGSFGEVLVSGGDERVLLRKDTCRNKYNVPAAPIPNAVLRGSCTCSPPSEAGYFAAKTIFDEICGAPVEQMDEVASAKMRILRQQLLRLFCPNLQCGDDSRSNRHPLMVTSPSGTDCETFITALALVRSRYNMSLRTSSDENQNGCVTNIIVCAGEVGSGTALSAEGKAFGNVTPFSDQFQQWMDQGCVGERTEGGTSDNNNNNSNNITDNESNAAAIKLQGICMGESFLGFENAVDVVCFGARDMTTGDASDNLELQEKISSLVHKEIKLRNRVVVLHMVNSSKTGLHHPSLDFVKQLKTEYGDSLLVVVDSCQMRLPMIKVEEYISHGFFVMVTGSKFFGGFCFSGATLIPRDQIAFLLQHLDEDLEAVQQLVPIGLSFSHSEGDFDEELLPLFRKSLTKGSNVGLLLRWHTALGSLTEFASMDAAKCFQAAKWWHDSVGMLLESSCCVKPWNHRGLDNNEETLSETVSCFTFHPAVGERNEEVDCCVNDKQQLGVLTRLLTMDAVNFLPDDASNEDKAAVSAICFIGQDVLVGKDVSVLRLALDSKELCKIVSSLNSNNTDQLNRILENDRTVLKKISTLGRYWRHVLTCDERK